MTAAQVVLCWLWLCLPAVDRLCFLQLPLRRAHDVPVPVPDPALLHPACAQPFSPGGASGGTPARLQQPILSSPAYPAFPLIVEWPLTRLLTCCLPPALPALPLPLQGIALASDREYKVLGAAYPWVARRLLTDTSPELRSTLMALLYKDGVFQFKRMESLISQAVRPTGRPQPRRSPQAGQSEWRCAGAVFRIAVQQAGCAIRSLQALRCWH